MNTNTVPKVRRVPQLIASYTIPQKLYSSSEGPYSEDHGTI